MNPSRWAFPILVIRPSVGAAMRHNSSMSSGLLAPISIMAIWCCALSLSSVKGTPIWLFRLPSVQSTLYCVCKAQLTSSLVLVLPLLPVMPSTGMSKRRRWAWASSWRKASPLGTKKIFASLASAALSTIAYLAPEAIACSAYWLPSKLSPLSAIYKQSFWICLESVLTPLQASKRDSHFSMRQSCKKKARLLGLLKYYLIGKTNYSLMSGRRELPMRSIAHLKPMVADALSSSRKRRLPMASQ